MSKTKDNFDQLVANQTQLAETLTHHANKAWETMTVEDTFTAKARELNEEFAKKQVEWAKTAMSQETIEHAFEKMPELFNQAVELQTAYMNRATELSREFFAHFGIKQQQERAKQLTDIFRGSYNAMVETASANTKLMQGFFA